MRGGALALLGAMIGSVSATAGGTHQPETVAAIRAAIERPRILGSWSAKPQFALSADGRRVAFVVETPDIATNSVAVDLWVAPTGRIGAASRLVRLRGSARNAPSGGSPAASLKLVQPAISPDGTKVAVVGYGPRSALAIVDVASRHVRIVTGGLDGDFRDVEWSPDGQRVAVQFSPTQRGTLQTGVEVGVDWDGRSLSSTASRIAVIDATRNRLIALTPGTLDVAGIASAFSWSSDGRRIAFSAHPAAAVDYSFQDDDIYLFDPAAAAVKQVIGQPGPDLDPRWSPDGRRLAFLSAAGIAGFDAKWRLGIYDFARDDSRYVARSDETAQTPYSIAWFDPTHVSFVAMRRMGCPLFLADAASLEAQQLSPDDLSCMSGAQARAGKIYSVRHSFIQPGQLLQSPAARWEPTPIGPVVLSTQLPATERIVSWPSTDGMVRVHGVLIEPLRRATGKAPLLVSVAGGPGMVTPGDYNEDSQHLIYPALLRGYSVLVPNTRGRGGYGEAFSAAIVDRRDYMPGPYADVLDGVDYLVRAGVADPDKVALAGFSYGAILSAYAAATTDRFRLVMATEGAVDFYSRALQAYGSIGQANGRSVLGFSDPFDATDRRLLLEQSPLMRAAGVHVPVLLECGSESLAPGECLKFLRAVRRQSRAPIDLIVYPRTGHGIFEPALRFDSAIRQTAWLDRWMASPRDQGAAVGVGKAPFQ